MDEQELEVLQDLESGLEESEPLEPESSETPDEPVNEDDSRNVVALGATKADIAWNDWSYDDTRYNKGLSLNSSLLAGQVHSSTYDLMSRMDTLEGNVIAAVGSGSGSGGAPDEDAVYTVVLDDSQVGTFRSAARVLCTEGLLVVLLLALLCGMQAWRIFSSKWVGV